MIRRRITAVALAAGCLLSQTGCTGLGFGGSNNACAPASSSSCCLGGGGLFSRMFSPAPAATCCTPACVPASPCSTCSSGSPIVTSGFESGIPVSGGSPGCGCNRGADPFQFTGMQGMTPGAITTIPGPMSQGAPINVGPEFTTPIPSGPPPYIPGQQPTGPPQPPRIVPVPQMQQSPVPAGAFQPGGTAYSGPWTPGH